MATSLDRLESELMSLPANDRARLAERLLASLDDAGEEDPGEVERAWLDEAERRYQRYLSGEESARPAEEVLARVRELLRQP
jgi:putative addiction module component (TIGR02574 family)